MREIFASRDKYLHMQGNIYMQEQIFANGRKNICKQREIFANVRDRLGLGRLGDGQKDKQDGKVVAATRILHSNQIE